ncbi:OmpA family protein [Actinocrispum wychmicini]|uniref:Outer membrane protein OmpA-like peptidoglycan-associated protein n=1 Tax=Actinocrispum wychmicini TaxID=1213861 RepID=A0A4R2JQG8_9PSEU|nr:OmpA family protein [Actinocrispum wychmicini]TCO59436.1 outer membrane protein OmpA-like peptidoglycan-associated protein [Actinocrispum wychmicini]
MATFDPLPRVAVARMPESSAARGDAPWLYPGNGAMTRLLVSREEDGQQQKTDDAGSAPAGHDSVCVWFPLDSAEPRQDSEVNSAGHIAVAVTAVKAQLARDKNAKITIAGYASEEGAPDHNQSLSARRAARIKALLVTAGIPAEQLVDIGRGVSRSWPGRAWNRRVDVEVTYDSATEPTETPVDSRESRSYTNREAIVMERLEHLSNVAQREGPNGAAFAAVNNDFRTALRQRMTALKEGDPLPDDLQIVMKALILWSKDKGTTWGEGIFDSTDVTLSCADYATVPASQNKCSSYVAEVLFEAVGTVHKVYTSDEQAGKFFPNRAADWGDTAKVISNYPVVSSPALGDVWSNGHHVGIFLGNYNGQLLYISARDDGDGVFGLGKAQHAHGIQIKLMPAGGVYRHFQP